MKTTKTVYAFSRPQNLDSKTIRQSVIGKLQIFHSFNVSTGPPSSKYVAYTKACVYRELYGKITDRNLKNCVNSYFI